MDYQLEELSLEVTNECPLACLHCSSGSSPERLHDELTYLEHMRLIREARGLGATVLSLSGGNPLHYDELIGLIRYASDLEYERILIYTTGHNRLGSTVRLWPDLDEAIAIPGVVWISSLHSHIAATNDYIMNVPGTYSNITKSLRYLLDHNQEVEIHMVPMSINFKDIPDMRLWCEDMGISKLSLLRFVPQTRGLLNFDVLGMDKFEFITMQLLIHNEMLRESSVELRAGCPIDFRHSLGLLDKKAKPCHAGDDLILVRPDGAVHPCAAVKSIKGMDCNVRDHSLEWIWENAGVFVAMRHFKEVGYKEINDGECSNCSMVQSCKYGCLAQRLQLYGRTLSALYDPRGDPLCPRTK